jgi:hypothetical protein
LTRDAPRQEHKPPDARTADRTHDKAPSLWLYGLKNVVAKLAKGSGREADWSVDEANMSQEGISVYAPVLSHLYGLHLSVCTHLAHLSVAAHAHGNYLADGEQRRKRGNDLFNGLSIIYLL